MGLGFSMKGMARQGAPPAVLAELLDHTDLQHVMVYVNSGPEAVGRLDQALDHQLRPVVSRFLGRLVDSERNADRHEPSARVYGTVPTLVNLGGIGTCGSRTWCNLYP